MSDRKTVGLIVGSLVAAICVVAAVAGVANQGTIVDSKLERSCHREVAKRVPPEIRDLETNSYYKHDATMGVMTGSVKARQKKLGWAAITWKCRVHPESGRVLDMEFAKLNRGGRLKAAASAF